MTPETIARAKLKKLPPRSERCSALCKGWFIDSETFEPTRCDECARGSSDPLTDADVAALPEAQEAREKSIQLVHNEEHGTSYGMFAEWCPHCLAKLSWLKPKEPPYPWCMHPSRCIPLGRCPRNPNCGE